MQDRIPTYPGRTKITHADGTVEYVTIERADEAVQDGTLINTLTLLAPETASKYALPASTATPNMAFAILADALLSSGEVTVIVKDADGQPIQGVTLDNTIAVGGGVPVTGPDGKTKIVLVNDTDVTFHSGYADIPDYTTTIPKSPESISAVNVTLPYATAGSERLFTESGEIKFRKQRTVSLSVIGGGTGGTGGQRGWYDTNDGGDGGAGGSGGKVLNLTNKILSGTYSLVIGAGGLGGDSGDKAYDHGTPGTSGGNTTFGGFSSQNGNVDTIPIGSFIVGGAGGKGGTGGLWWNYVNRSGTVGSAGIRAGAKGGYGGLYEGVYLAEKGYDAGIGGGGGGGGGGFSDKLTYAGGGRGGPAAGGGKGGDGCLVMVFQ